MLKKGMSKSTIINSNRGLNSIQKHDILLISNDITIMSIKESFC